MRIETRKTKHSGILTYHLLDAQNKEVKAVNDYLAFLRVQNYSPNTLKNYAYDLKYLFEYLESRNQKYDLIRHRQVNLNLARYFGNLLDSGKIRYNYVEVSHVIIRSAKRSSFPYVNH